MRAHKAFPIVILVLVLIITASCNILGPKALATPDALAFQATLNAAATEAIMTIQAQFTQTAEAMPTEPFVPIPSATPEPTSAATATTPPTATVGPPTWTPVPSWTPSLTPTLTSAFTATATATRSPFSCTIVSISPPRGASIPYRNDFDARFTLKNDGTRDWIASNVDFKYVSGEKMQKYGDSVDMSKDVKVGEEYTFVIDMLAPDQAGNYSATWNLVEGSTIYCSVTLDIRVTR